MPQPGMLHNDIQVASHYVPPALSPEKRTHGHSLASPDTSWCTDGSSLCGHTYICRMASRLPRGQLTVHVLYSVFVCVCVRVHPFMFALVCVCVHKISVCVRVHVCTTARPRTCVSSCESKTKPPISASPVHPLHYCMQTSTCVCMQQRQRRGAWWERAGEDGEEEEGFAKSDKKYTR